MILKIPKRILGIPQMKMPVELVALRETRMSMENKTKKNLQEKPAEANVKILLVRIAWLEQSNRTLNGLTDPRMLSRTRLEREYVLNSLLATFIRALRVGVLNAGHCAVVLAQYGRFGMGFDSTIKVVIEFLRDLGMFKEQGQLVFEIIVRAMQEVKLKQFTTCSKLI